MPGRESDLNTGAEGERERGTVWPAADKGCPRTGQAAGAGACLPSDTLGFSPGRIRPSHGC